MEPYYRERLMTLLLENMAQPTCTSTSRLDGGILNIGKLAYLTHCFVQAYLPPSSLLLLLPQQKQQLQQQQAFIPWPELEAQASAFDGALTPALLRVVEAALMPLFHGSFPVSFCFVPSTTQQQQRDAMTMALARKTLLSRIDYWLQPRHYATSHCQSWQLAAYRALLVFPWAMNHSGQIGLAKRFPDTFAEFVAPLGAHMGPTETFYMLLPHIIPDPQGQMAPPPAAHVQSALPRLKQEYDQWKSAQLALLPTALASSSLPHVSSVALLQRTLPQLVIRAPPPTATTTRPPDTDKATPAASAASAATVSSSSAKTRAPKRKHEALTGEGGEIMETEDSAEAQNTAKRPRVEC